jgi:E3 ubiquitin-protein ligase HECTD1
MVLTFCLEQVRQRANARTREEDTWRSLGHLKQERVVVKRGDEILEWAMNVMKVHAKRKAILEVTFAEEEGHGTGVTSEFYSLVSEALQRREIGMWMCDDTGNAAPMKKTKAAPVNQTSKSTDIAIAARGARSNQSTDIAIAARGEGGERGEARDRDADNKVHYIHRESGLFPAPLPPDAPNIEKILERFRFLGTFIAKALLDGRLVSLPLSRPLYKALCGVPIVAADLVDIDPEKARHLAHLHKVALQKRAADAIEDPLERKRALAAMEDVELYSLTMEYAPSSTMHGFSSFELIPDGANVTVTNDRVHEYVKLMYRFILDEGVRSQIDAIRQGISEVFSCSHLQALTPAELRSILSGEERVNWAKEELLEHLEPRNGYDADSPTFLHLVHVLADMEEGTRKDFLRFATGVRVLPPGGLKNLEPKLTVVRKHCETNPDAHFPSANTCFHFLKLPEYSSEEILRARLNTALLHGMDGFFFN